MESTRIFSTARGVRMRNLTGRNEKTLTDVQCDECLGMFKDRKSEAKRYERHFCSKACRSKFVGKSLRSKVTLQCFHCGKDVERKPSEIAKTKHYTFCSNRCTAFYHNAHKTRGVNRSIGECWLYLLLKKNFPSLSVIENDREVLDGYEIDILLPEVKLAIEYNGILRFEPICSHEKLSETMGRDARKHSMLTEKQISLLSITEPKRARVEKVVRVAYEKVCVMIKEVTGTLPLLVEVTKEQAKQYRDST
jgi:endogenous inhibitor of DNA gyrase (YacG/DUF329 family)